MLRTHSATSWMCLCHPPKTNTNLQSGVTRPNNAGHITLTGCKTWFWASPGERGGGGQCKPHSGGLNMSTTTAVAASEGSRHQKPWWPPSWKQHVSIWFYLFETLDLVAHVSDTNTNSFMASLWTVLPVIRVDSVSVNLPIWTSFKIFGTLLTWLTVTGSDLDFSPQIKNLSRGMIYADLLKSNIHNWT